jgi:hypothetical protein
MHKKVMAGEVIYIQITHLLSGTGDKLVGFTKAYSGLTDKEFAQVDNFVKRNSLEKFDLSGL